MTGSELKKERLSLGLTQVEMAEKFETPVSTYRKWENGSRRVPGIVKPALKWLKSQVKK